ncbi:MAG: isocitrate lyase [Deltaproteobacteria bacterium]|nr:isocitrate lyase [Deltaproteobacteria bacterium]
MQGPRTAEEIRRAWETDPRWNGIRRTYRAEDVARLAGTVTVEQTLARMGAERLWRLLHEEAPIRTLGALTGNQAIQVVQGGLKAIYASGWQMAGDANSAFQVYPDQSLYPVNTGPDLVRRLNNALQRADQVSHMEGRKDAPYWFAPIVADMEAGFGGTLNTYELTRAMIEAGAAGVHLEDQLSSLKKCGHMGGKVLVPLREAIEKLVAARLASDVLDVPTVIVARTDAEAAKLIRSDVDPRDRDFIPADSRTSEGYYGYRGGLDACISRGVAFAPYADLIWMETSVPDLHDAKRFSEGVRREFPDKLLAYNCSPSFNWARALDAATIAKFQRELGAMGFAFQFVTLAGFHTLNASMFELARGYRDEGMSAYVRVQQREFELELEGYEATRHQRFVGAGYFDDVATVIGGADISTTALKGSTEEAQFDERRAVGGAAARG